MTEQAEADVPPPLHPPPTLPASSCSLTSHGVAEVWGTEGNRAPVKKKEEVVVEPNFMLSGVLAAETNTVIGGHVLVYTEPPEAAKATLRWRLYTFKNGEPFTTRGLQNVGFNATHDAALR